MSAFSFFVSAALVFSVQRAYNIGARVDRLHAVAPKGADSATLFFDMNLDQPRWTPHRVQLHSAKCSLLARGVETLAEVPHIRYAGPARISFQAHVRVAPVGTVASVPECEISSTVDLFGTGFLVPRTVRKPLAQGPIHAPSLWLERTGALTRTSPLSVHDSTVALEQPTLVRAHVPAGSLPAALHDLLGGAQISMETSFTYVEGDDHSIRLTKTINSSLIVESDGRGGYRVSLPANVTGHVHPRRVAATLGKVLMGRPKPYEGTPPVKPGQVDRSVRLVAAEPGSLTARLLGESHACGWRTHGDSFFNKLLSLVPNWAGRKAARKLANATEVEEVSLLAEGRRLLMGLPDMQVIFQEGFYMDWMNLETEWLGEMTEDEIRVTFVTNTRMTEPMYDDYDHGLQAKFLLNFGDGVMKFESLQGEQTYVNVTLDVQPGRGGKFVDVLVNDPYSGKSVLELTVEPAGRDSMELNGKINYRRQVLKLTGAGTQGRANFELISAASRSENGRVEGKLELCDESFTLGLDIWPEGKDKAKGRQGSRPEITVDAKGDRDDQGLTFPAIKMLGREGALLGKLEPVALTASPPSFKTTAFDGQDNEIATATFGPDDSGGFSGGITMANDMMVVPHAPCLEGSCSLKMTMGPTMQLTIDSTPAGEVCDDTAPAGATGIYGRGCVTFEGYTSYYPDFCEETGAMYDDTDFTLGEMCCTCGGGVAQSGSKKPSLLLSVKSAEYFEAGVMEGSLDVSLKAHGATALGVKLSDSTNLMDQIQKESAALTIYGVEVLEVGSEFGPGGKEGEYSFQTEGAVRSPDGYGSMFGWSLSLHEAFLDSTLKASVTGEKGTLLGELTLDKSASGAHSVALSSGPLSYELQVDPSAPELAVLSDGGGQVATLSVTQPEEGTYSLTITSRDPIPVSGATLSLADQNPQATLEVLDPSGEGMGTLTVGYSLGQGNASAQVGILDASGAAMGTWTLGYSADEMPLPLNSNFGIMAAFAQGEAPIPGLVEWSVSVGCKASDAEGESGAFAASATIDGNKLLDISGTCGDDSIEGSGAIWLAAADFAVAKPDGLLISAAAVDASFNVDCGDEGSSKWSLSYDGIASLTETMEIKQGADTTSFASFEISDGQWVAGKYWVGPELEETMAGAGMEAEKAVEEELSTIGVVGASPSPASSPSLSPSPHIWTPGFFYTSFNFSLGPVDDKIWLQNYEQSEYEIESTNYSIQLPSPLATFDFDVRSVVKERNWWEGGDSEWKLVSSDNFSIQEKKVGDSPDFLSATAEQLAQPPPPRLYQVIDVVNGTLAGPSVTTALSLLVSLGGAVICAVFIMKRRRHQGQLDVEQSQLLSVDEP